VWVVCPVEPRMESSMSSPATQVPDAVRLKADAQGSDGRRWLGRLGRLIGDLERNWGASIGPALSGGRSRT
jgi:streptomycin 6-kinase